jgi:serine/threonine protein kinase
MIDRLVQRVSDNGEVGLTLPARYGKYELLERIGAGGMAEVYRARLPGIAGFEKTVVIKRLHARYAHQLEFVQLFVEEAKLAAEVQHKNVVQVFDLGSLEDGQVYMAMEYIAGTDLKNLLRMSNQRGQRIPPWFSTYVAVEVLEALAFAHDLVDQHGRLRNIVHCDVTPENVFLSRVGEVKLGDFGVAQDDARTSEPFADQLKGKVPYMSPEQVLGRRADRRADVFAMGIVLWECLTQRRLFAATTQQETMRKLVQAPRVPPSHLSPDVPPELDALVLGALEPNPDHRIPNARAMQERLQEILEGLRPRHNLADVREALHLLMSEPRPPSDPEGIIDLSESAVLAVAPSPPPRRTTSLPAEVSAFPDLPAAARAAHEAGSGIFSRPSALRSHPALPKVAAEGDEEVTASGDLPAGPSLEPGRVAYEAWMAMGGDPSHPPPRLPPPRRAHFTYGIVHPSHGVDRLGASAQEALPVLPIPSPPSGVETQDILRFPPARTPNPRASGPTATLLPGAPVPAEPPPRMESSADRHPLWIRAPGGAVVGPRGPTEALDALTSFLEGTPPELVAIASSSKRWVTADRLGVLLAEPVAVNDGRALRGDLSGDLEQDSLVSLLGHLSRTQATGRLLIDKKTPHGRTRRELRLERGWLVGGSPAAPSPSKCGVKRWAGAPGPTSSRPASTRWWIARAPSARWPAPRTGRRSGRTMPG